LDEVKSYDSTRRPDFESWLPEVGGRSFWWPSSATAGEVFSVNFFFVFFLLLKFCITLVKVGKTADVTHAPLFHPPLFFSFLWLSEFRHCGFD
jgi:hypothetical protein